MFVFHYRLIVFRYIKSFFPSCRPYYIKESRGLSTTAATRTSSANVFVSKEIELTSLVN